MDPVIEEWQRYEKCERRRAGAKAAIKRGLWLLAVAGGILGAMYLYAMSQPGGGSVLVFWGALAFGGFNLLGGLIRLGPACRQPSMSYRQALAYAQATQQWTPQQAAAWQAQQTSQWQQFPAPQQPLPLAYAPPPAPPRRSPGAAFLQFVYKALVFVLVVVIALVIGAFIVDAVTGGSLSR